VFAVDKRFVFSKKKIKGTRFNRVLCFLIVGDSEAKDAGKRQERSEAACCAGSGQRPGGRKPGIILTG
jgi:hypothetical protein